jgi:CheY-like chemotaxis protein
MQDIFSRLEKSKPRILFVENDPIARVPYQALLMDWGYEPVLAMGTGKALLDDAKKQAREKRCVLALIDLRLVDDDDEQDMSGLTLAEDLRPYLHPIILSGYENQSLLRNLLRNHKDIPFFAKQDRRDEFQKALDTEAAKVSASKRGLQFEGTETLNDFMKSSLAKEIGEYSDQIPDIFAQLFPTAAKLRFEKLDSWMEPSNISSAVRPNSIVLKVYEDNLEPWVVKLARAGKIQQEVKNYYGFIARKLTGNFVAQLMQRAIRWDIGGAAYSYVGGNGTRTFTHYYKEQTIGDIEEILSTFFSEVWRKYYEQPHRELDASLFNLYSRVWGSDWYEKCMGDFASRECRRLEGILKEIDLPQPIEWILNKIINAQKDISMMNVIHTTITHGDIHGDNLLVDNKRNVWVIDFERCGEGHILQDFIELEADIFNRIEARNVNPSAYFKMCLFVLKQKTIQGFEEADTLSKDPRIEKALKTISVLRSLALRCTRITDSREYLFGLLFNMVFHAALIHKRDTEKSDLPLLLASLICHRLDHWDEAWPPAELNLI